MSTGEQDDEAITGERINKVGTSRQDDEVAKGEGEQNKEVAKRE